MLFGSERFRVPLVSGIAGYRVVVSYGVRRWRGGRRTDRSTLAIRLYGTCWVLMSGSSS